MMKSHTRTVSKSAHFYTLGNINSEVDQLWIACHGYGQSASKFLENFECIQAANRLIICPEGLSRFYWGGFSGPIVSSWMTSGDRLLEIKDYSNWLTSILEEILPQLSDNVKVMLLGFSQGTATAMRWLHAHQPAINQIILWAGMIPEDLSYLELEPYFSKIKKVFVYGLSDKFLPAERIEWQSKFMKEQRLNFSQYPFEGKHKIEEKTLLELLNKVFCHV